MMKKLLLLALCLTVTKVAAQETVPAVPVLPATPDTFTVTTSVVRPERFKVWGGLSSELFILPGATLGLSVPVSQMENMDVLLRGSATVTVLPLGGDSVDENGNIGGFGVLIPLPGANVDLLFSSKQPGRKWYAGPSVGTVMGAVWLFGGVAGVQNEFRGSAWGYFLEAKFRAATAGGDWFVSPGVNLGLTYRF